MRQAVHDVTIKCRVSSDLLAVLDAIASDRAMTRSEMLRQAIRKDVLPEGFEAEGAWAR